MSPAGLSRVYPLLGLCGCSHKQLAVGTGTAEVLVDALVVVFVVLAEQG